MAQQQRLSRRVHEFNCPFDYVQMDGLAVMKIIKHCYEERSNIETPRGGLLGLVIENRLEITNTFAFPISKADEPIDDEYTTNMMLHMKKINQDYLHVGWYQSCDLGSFVTAEFVLAQLGYQDSIEESIVVVYDPQKTSKGFLSLKVFRLTPQALKMLNESETNITPELVKSLHLSYDKMFHEVPLMIRNSPLANALCSQIVEMKPADRGTQFLDLGTASVMETHMKLMLEKVEEIHQEAYKMNKWAMQVSKQQQEKSKYIHQKSLENTARQAKGEPPLPEEDLSKIFRPIPPPTRLPPMLSSSQIEMSTQQITSFCSQALAKLFMSEALQQSKLES